MKGIQKITILTLAVLTLAACSRKKNSFINRNYHAVTGEYNALYNSEVAYDEGLLEVSRSYRDNFWEILPIERIELKEELTPGDQKNPNFNRAEEKAVKAIQKHSMYIDGTEYNPQIDEAYMLLGKARYFDTRFVPALDAFNFILDKYPTSNNINRAKVWKAKTNIRLNNEEVALENLQEMFDEAELDDQELAEGAAIMAQAYINLDSIAESLPFIKMASEYVRDNELKGRYSYIKGQIYNRLEMKDSANMAFDEVIDLNRKSPRVYMINAYIAKGRNFDYDKEDRIAFLELLQDLEQNRENRPFLDKIYNQMGEYYRNTKNIDTAVTFYNKSIRAFDNDNTLQSVNYQTLAEINFDAAEYKTAGAYYDSTLTHLLPNTKQWRRITKKRENLDDVIKYEDIAAVNDSVLRIAGMTEAQQVAFFTEYANKLKEKAIADSIASIEIENQIANNEFFKKQIGGPTEKGGKFYFYNSSTLAYGKQEFKRIWGNRKLEDGWRLSSKQTVNFDEEIVESSGTTIGDNPAFDPESYLALIPREAAVIDSITRDRDFAYYQLGLIYKEKFKEYNLAANRLETLISYNPEERLVLPSLYNLHKIYLQMEDNAKAEKYKNDILNGYADSRYAEILRNPNAQLSSDESSPEYKYKALYDNFEASRYQQVIDKCEEYIITYNGNDIVPKLEMLKATSLARRDGFEAYKKALNFIALNYPNTDEGKQAQRIFSTILPGLADKEFYGDEQSDSWKVVYNFSSTDRTGANELKKKLDEAITFYNYGNMTTSIDYYTPSTIFVVIHGLNTKLGGRGFGEVLRDNKKFTTQRAFFEISTPNYKIIQIHKNLDDYMTADLTKNKEKSAEGVVKSKQERLKEETKMREEKKKNGGAKPTVKGRLKRPRSQGPPGAQKAKEKSGGKKGKN